VARHPKFSIEKVAMRFGVFPKPKRRNYSSEPPRFVFSAGAGEGDKSLRLITRDAGKAQKAQGKR